MDPLIAQREIFLTEDGSSTLKLLNFNEQFHSIHGALTESQHIYIGAGFKKLAHLSEIKILEIGFGTGLNAILTFQENKSQIIHYHAIEAYPLTPDEVQKLNYHRFLSEEEQNCFLKMHQNQQAINIHHHFHFKKEIAKIEDLLLPVNEYDLVYFDAFSPETQPELWSETIFNKLALSMKAGGILVTYCAKGSVKRALKQAGFSVEGLPGPPGKREITRALKN